MLLSFVKFCNNRPTYDHCSNENKRDIKFLCECGKLLSYGWYYQHRKTCDVYINTEYTAVI